VAARVQTNCTAVSYPGVGRFRRAETGILGRANKGSPYGTPFFYCLFAFQVEPVLGDQSCTGASTSCRVPTKEIEQGKGPIRRLQVV
jgi:hypothetical protein